MSPTWISLRPLTWSPKTFLPLNCRLQCLVEKELTDSCTQTVAMRAVRQWNRLPRGAVDTPSMGVFKVRLLWVFEQSGLVKVDSVYCREVGRYELQRSFPTKNILWFDDSIFHVHAIWKEEGPRVRVSVHHEVTDICNIL